MSDEINSLIEEEIVDHTQLVRECENKIHGLGLITFRKTRDWSGFIPDIVTNVGGKRHGWVLIDIVNSPSSLIRDAGGLLLAKATIEMRSSDKVRALCVLTSKNVVETRVIDPLIAQHNGLLWWQPIDYIENLLRWLMRHAFRDFLCDVADWYDETFWGRAGWHKPESSTELSA
jgi:hypothetical protein